MRLVLIHTVWASIFQLTWEVSSIKIQSIFNLICIFSESQIRFIVYDHKNYYPFFFVGMWLHLANNHRIVLCSGICDSLQSYYYSSKSKVIFTWIVMETRCIFYSSSSCFLFVAGLLFTNWISTTMTTTICRLKTNKCHDEIMCCVRLIKSLQLLFRRLGIGRLNPMIGVQIFSALWMCQSAQSENDTFFSLSFDRLFVFFSAFGL